MSLKDSIKKAVRWDAPGVKADESLRSAMIKMIESNVSAFAVTSAGAVVGVITDMDLMRNVVAMKNFDTTTVAQCMTACDLITSKGAASPCVQLHETETVGNALGVMDMAGVHNLLVSGDDEGKTGMISIRDLLRIALL